MCKCAYVQMCTFEKYSKLRNISPFVWPGKNQTSMTKYSKKEIAFERVLFFSDAIVAIAITLLALDLKIQIPEGKNLTFTDLISPWHKYLAFILSFVNIAGYWRTHHDFFVYIHKMDDRIFLFNILWLFFIICLPFATTVLSDHFGQTPAVFLYSLNVLSLSVFQNCIWDYADKSGFLNTENLNEERRKGLRLMLNLDMLNGLIAVTVSFFMPKTAFFLLFFKLPLFVFALIFGTQRRQIHLKKSD
jgi:uncharacterized membrane protein